MRRGATPRVRRRLDAELVRRDLASDRRRARELIEAGRVTVGGAPAPKPSRMVAPGEAIEVAAPPPRFVSRGGDKLDAALEAFDIPVAGTRALDVGASTGGFTDCLLQRGAAAVVALDVGRNQLHERLRRDPRVEDRPRTNIRHVGPGELGPPFDVVVADLSFISITLVIDRLLGLTAPGGHLVLLVKPQFEAGRAEATRGRGVIRDPAVWRRVLEEVTGACGARGAAIMGVMVSPLTGADGNAEFLLHARRPPAPGGRPVDLDAVVADALALVGGRGAGPG
ncbi:MAG: TlyA family RNA methyltransferase [Acidimicrobiia bacterium]